MPEISDEMGNMAGYLFGSKVHVLQSSITCWSMDYDFGHMSIHSGFWKRNLIKGDLDLITLLVRNFWYGKTIADSRFES